jgi:histidine triad (HIT) family protein
MSEPCIFCEIIARRATASFVAESDLAIAFLTIGPLREGHALVIPKRHVVEVPDAAARELGAVFALGQEVAIRQRRTLGSHGETLFLASGAAGEQSVFHMHLHVVPRHDGDGIGLAAWWGTKMHRAERAALDATAARLRA